MALSSFQIQLKQYNDDVLHGLHRCTFQMLKIKYVTQNAALYERVSIQQTFKQLKNKLNKILG